MTIDSLFLGLANLACNGEGGPVALFSPEPKDIHLAERFYV